MAAHYESKPRPRLSPVPMADVQPDVKGFHDFQTPENGDERRARGEGDGEGVRVALDQEGHCRMGGKRESGAACGSQADGRAGRSHPRGCCGAHR